MRNGNAENVGMVERWAANVVELENGYMPGVAVDTGNRYLPTTQNTVYKVLMVN